MSIFERRSSINAAFPIAKAVGSLDEAVLALPGLVGFWDFDPSRVVSGTDTALANRVSGGVNATEVTAVSGLTLATTGLPPGGQLRQCGSFNANTSMSIGSFPTGGSSRFTKVMIFKLDKAIMSGGAQTLWGGPAGGTSNHFMTVTGSTLTHSVGTTGSTANPQQRVAVNAWQYVIASWDASTGVATVSAGGATPTTVTSLGQANNQGTSYIGGNATAGTLKGQIGAMLLFSAAGSDGDLFNAGNAARLSLVREMLEAKIGVLNL